MAEILKSTENMNFSTANVPGNNKIKINYSVIRNRVDVAPPFKKWLIIIYGGLIIYIYIFFLIVTPLRFRVVVSVAWFCKIAPDLISHKPKSWTVHLAISSNDQWTGGRSPGRSGPGFQPRSATEPRQNPHEHATFEILRGRCSLCTTKSRPINCMHRHVFLFVLILFRPPP